jgi:hypothetical protein
MRINVMNFMILIFHNFFSYINDAPKKELYQFYDIYDVYDTMSFMSFMRDAGGTAQKGRGRCVGWKRCDVVTRERAPSDVSRGFVTCRSHAASGHPRSSTGPRFSSHNRKRAIQLPSRCVMPEVWKPIFTLHRQKEDFIFMVIIYAEIKYICDK